MNDLIPKFQVATEAAALATAEWIGRGLVQEADQAATKMLRAKLNDIAMNGVVVIGEGEIDQAPMLHIGETLGHGIGIPLDIAVDPVEGTRLVAYGQDHAMVTIAAAPRGCLFHAPDMYMEKLVVGPKAIGKIDIDYPLRDNLNILANCLNKNIEDVVVAVQKRERHRHIIKSILDAGAKVRLFSDGDVSFAIASVIPNSGIDLMVGVGGAPEGTLSAVAVKCAGGDMQARLVVSNEEEYDRCKKMGISKPDDRLSLHDLVVSDDSFFIATGITNGLFLKGVMTMDCYRETHSLILSGQDKRIHFVKTYHDLLEKRTV